MNCETNKQLCNTPSPFQDVPNLEILMNRFFGSILHLVVTNVFIGGLFPIDKTPSTQPTKNTPFNDLAHYLSNSQSYHC